MRTIVRLLFVIALLNALVQCGLVAWTYFEFKDASQKIVLFSGSASPEDMQSDILARAKDLKVPVVPSDVTVHREGVRTVAVATYTQQVELFPRVSYPVPLSFSVDALSYGGAYRAPAAKPSSGERR
jgi:hypothetical protein